MFSYFSLPGDTAQVGCICTDSAVCWVGCVSPSSETTFGKSGSKGREWLGTTCASLCGGHVQHFPAVTIGRWVHMSAWHRNPTGTLEFFCKEFLHFPTCVPSLKVLPKAEPWQLAALARSQGKVGAPKVELAHFYDALEDWATCRAWCFMPFSVNSKQAKDQRQIT